MTDVLADEPGSEQAAPEIHTLCFRRGGQVYWGDCEKRGTEYVRHGQGLQVWGAHNVRDEPLVVTKYSGNWDGGSMRGSGRMEFYDNSLYIGDFEIGNLHGVGKFTWPDGSSYDGCWEMNQMHGQGRYLAATGEFLEGHFHRNCFLQNSGKWIDLAKEQARIEQLALAEGAVGPETPVHLVSNAKSMHDAIRSCTAANLVPFIIRDTSFPEGTSPLTWLKLEDPVEGDCVLSLRYLAQMRRRKQTYLGYIYDRLQKGIITGCSVPLVFDVPESEDDAIPKDWSLENFYESFSAPREMFNPRLFHGRGFAEFFLPEDQEQTSVFAKSWFPTPPAPSPVGTDDIDEDEEEKYEPPASMSLDERKVAFLLFLRVVAMSCIRSDIVDDHDYVRRELSQKFGAHIPLHRCGIVILTSQ
jgi:hypothetical protein